jgi:polyisoprenoid-binding protein YceI
MKRLAWPCALLLAGTCHAARAADWRMDSAGSSLEFVATFEKTPAPGIFRSFDTRLRLDPGKPAENRLDVAVNVTSADMNSADINNGIRGPEWFDFARFPKAEFHSTEIRRTDAKRYLARGTLSLKGVQQPVDVPFVWSDTGDAAIMEGELTLGRLLFGIGTGEWAATNVIGADVKVKFRVRLRKAG